MVKLMRRRYVAFQLMPRTEASKREIYEALMRSLSLSENGGGRPPIRVIDYNVEKGLGIIRCGHKYIGQLLNSIEEAEGVSAELNLKTLGTSGSIKALKRRFYHKSFK